MSRDFRDSRDSPIEKSFRNDPCLRSRNKRRNKVMTRPRSCNAKVLRRNLERVVGATRGVRDFSVGRDLGGWIRVVGSAFSGALDSCPKSVQIILKWDCKSGRPEDADPTTTDPTPVFGPWNFVSAQIWGRLGLLGGLGLLEVGF